MAGFKQKYGQTALVAGASEGIGAAFCHVLAKEGANLVMIARRKEPLDAEAEQIRKQYGVKVTTVALDLADDDIVAKIETQIGTVEIDILVYNAALSNIGPFLDKSIEEHLMITKVNMQSSMRLVHHYGALMVGRRRGAVMLMASLAGFQGSGFLSTYGATKAFDRVLAEGLWYEWKDKGVDVIACCAGATSTPNFLQTKPAKQNIMAPRVQSPIEVVTECMERLGTVPSFVPGIGNKWASFFMKLMSRRIAVNIMGDTARSMYKIEY